jgi:Tfp pilus assembly protein PilF
MSELEQLRLAINGSSEHWKAGEHEKAMKLLDDAITTAIKENNGSSIRALSHHAAVMANSVGDLRRVRHYYEQSLLYNPENPKALYGLARVSAEEGKPELAKRYATRCHEAVLRSDDEVDRGLLELIVKQWPELGSAG